MLVTLINTAKHVNGIHSSCNHELAQLRLSQCRNYLPGGLGGRLPDGNAPPRDGGAAGELAQLDVGAHRPYKPHRVAELPAPRDLVRALRRRSRLLRRGGIAVAGRAAEAAAPREQRQQAEMGGAEEGTAAAAGARAQGRV